MPKKISFVVDDIGNGPDNTPEEVSNPAQNFFNDASQSDGVIAYMDMDGHDIEMQIRNLRIEDVDE